MEIAFFAPHERKEKRSRSFPFYLKERKRMDGAELFFKGGEKNGRNRTFFTKEQKRTDQTLLKSSKIPVPPSVDDAGGGEVGHQGRQDPWSRRSTNHRDAACSMAGRICDTERQPKVLLFLQFISISVSDPYSFLSGSKFFHQSGSRSRLETQYGSGSRFF